MNSPIVPNSEVILIRNIEVSKIIEAYLNSFNIDVSRFFINLDSIQLYECQKTGYQFFAPMNVIMGDATFYEDLEKLEWYYMSWKWENQMLLNGLKKGDKILEIGSGGLGFIDKINKMGFDITGLELNNKSIKTAKTRGLKVEPILIEEYADMYPNQFDVVCAFQVLEHLSNVQDFLNASIKALKVGGKLVVCVPNNDSFIKLESPLMNCPPHHVGWWNNHSLTMLQKYFPIKLIMIECEPLHDYHFNWFINLQMENGIGKHIPFGKRLFKLFYSRWMKLKQSKINGLAIYAVYEKI